jgi:multiple sugar transport system permease protein
VIKGLIKSMKRKENESNKLFLFILPALLIILLTQAYPLIYSLIMSFRDWELVRSMKPKGFVGFANYIKAFKDPLFVNAFKISLIFCVFATTFEIVLGFVLAYFTTGGEFVMRIIRTILILPMVIAPVVTGTIWRMILNTNTGLLNILLGLIGIDGLNWLGDPTLAFRSVIFIDVWQWTPFAFIVFSAGFSIIPLEVYEAAKIDGAGRLIILKNIIIPYLIPVTFIALLFRVVDTLLVLDSIYTTTFGGPGFSTNVITLFVYWQSLRYFNISYASATSWILSLITVSIALFLIKSQNTIKKRLWGIS